MKTIPRNSKGLSDEEIDQVYEKAVNNPLERAHALHNLSESFIMLGTAPPDVVRAMLAKEIEFPELPVNLVTALLSVLGEHAPVEAKEAQNHRQVILEMCKSLERIHEKIRQEFATAVEELEKKDIILVGSITKRKYLNTKESDDGEHSPLDHPER